MFVCFGFDDNAYADGIQWFRELVKNKKNPTGSGNPLTYDGSPVRATFFCTGGYGESDPAVATEWKLLVQDGHEIGNHSWDHPHGNALTTQQWSTQIQQTNTYLTQQIGVNASDITGFRTPFLEYSPNTMQALLSNGITFDCSIEFGFNGWTPIEGDPDWPPESSGVWHNSMTNPKTHQKLFWPHTLDNGSPPGHSAQGNPKIAGLWEVNVYTYLRPDNSGVVTGFDFNIWTTATKDYFINLMKHNYDQRHTGNRNPLTINAHTDYYTKDNADAEAAFPNANWEARRQAVEGFLDYILQKPETRVVPYSDMLKWMKNPVSLGQTENSKSISTGQSPIPFEIKTFSKNMVEFSVPTNDVYTFSLRTVQGRTIIQKSEFLNQDNSYRITLNNSLAGGAYVVRISNGKVSAVKKAVFMQ